MGEVRQLFKVNQLCPDAETQAAYLEHLAQRLRDGDLVIHKAVLLFTDEDHQIDFIPFGEQSTWMELAGMCDFGQLKIIT